MNSFLKNKLWLLYSILAALSWGFWGILTKFISGEISPFSTHFMFTIGMLFPLPFIIPKCKLSEFSKKGMFLGIAAGILAVCGNVSVYQSFNLGGQAAMVIPLTNLYPIITILIALFIFKEKLHWMNGLGIMIVIPAIILLSGQSQVLTDPISFFHDMELKAWLIFALLSLTLFGLFSASQKVTTSFISAEWSYISFIASSVIVAGAFITFGLIDFKFAQNSFWVGSLAGALDGLGVLFIYSAYKSNGKASQVSFIASSLQQVFVIFLAVTFLKEQLNLDSIIGIIMAIGGASLVSFEQNNSV